MRIILISALSFIFMVCGQARAADEQVSVQALVNRATALIGDRIRLTVEITGHAGMEVGFPAFKDKKIGDFEIKDYGKEIKKGFFGAGAVKYWYDIAAYSVGKHQIPQIEIKYRKKGDKDWKVIQTRPLNVTIESVLPKGKLPADIKDIKGPLYYFEINLFLVSGVLLLLFIATLIILYKLRKPPLPVRLPHEMALEELETIRGNFLKNSDVKDYYAGVSDCIRRYIERVFRLKAPEMTTEEFLGSLGESTALSSDQKGLLKEFLNVCDLVKFAKYAPAKGEMESVFLAAKKFIEETKNVYL